MTMTNKLLILLPSISILACANGKKSKSDKPLKVGDVIEISDYDLISINNREKNESKNCH